MSKKWYVVHAYSGFEKSVQRALVERIKRSDLADQFGQILVPVEEVVEMKGGQKAISERKFFPGYVLVEMEMTDDTWHLVKSTPKVTGFVGGTANKPTPITQKEVDAILRQVQEGVEAEGSRCDPAPGAGRRREAASEGAVRDGRGGAGQGRSVHGLPRQRRGRELREEQAPRVGDHLRPVDAGGAGFQSGGEGVTFGRRTPNVARKWGAGSSAPLTT
jgi:transcription termination/antitermination factor NusG